MTRTNLIAISLFVILAILGLIILLFWKIGIFKEEYEASALLREIQSRLDFIKSYDLKSGQSYLQNLSVEQVSLPQINQSELGRSTLFSNPK